MPRKIWDLKEDFEGTGMLINILDFLNRNIVSLVFIALFLICAITIGG